MSGSLIIFGLVLLVIAILAVTLRGEPPENTAERIISLLGHLARDPMDITVRAQLYGELQGSPLPSVPQHIEDGGWFDRSAPALTILATRHDTRVYVDWFFHRFHFVSGQKQKPLLWLHRLLQTEIQGQRNLQAFTNAAERLLATGTSMDAVWLYGCLLDAVQQTGGDPNVKAAAVRIGRLAYSAARPDRRPTIYDEQAIANDIAARVG